MTGMTLNGCDSGLKRSAVNLGIGNNQQTWSNTGEISFGQRDVSRQAFKRLTVVQNDQISIAGRTHHRDQQAETGSGVLVNVDTSGYLRQSILFGPELNNKLTRGSENLQCGSDRVVAPQSAASPRPVSGQLQIVLPGRVRIASRLRNRRREHKQCSGQSCQQAASRI